MRFISGGDLYVRDKDAFYVRFAAGESAQLNQVRSMGMVKSTQSVGGIKSKQRDAARDLFYFLALLQGYGVCLGRPEMAFGSSIFPIRSHPVTLRHYESKPSPATG